MAKHRAGDHQPPLEEGGLLDGLERVGHHRHEQPHEQREAHDREHRVVKVEDAKVEGLHPVEGAQRRLVEVGGEAHAEDGHVIDRLQRVNDVAKRSERTKAVEALSVAAAGGGVGHA